MSDIVFLGLAPHPPILIPEVGGEESKKVSSTYRAMELFAQKLAESGAESIVIISPHGSVFQDGVAINGCDMLVGDLKQFRADISFEYNNDIELMNEIISQAAKMGITALDIDDGLAIEYGVSSKLDHGVMVPAYFLDKKGIDLPLVSIGMSFMPFEELYAFGVSLKNAALALNRKVAIIASGDMSHRLTQDAPAGYSPHGVVFDNELKNLLESGDVKGIINIDRNMAERAGECGLRSLIMMLGATDGEEFDTEILSYEGPFGVGYMVAVIELKGAKKQSLLSELMNVRKEGIKARREGESIPVSLARMALEAHVKEGRKIVPDVSQDSLLEEKAGVFVSIKKHGQLRGCIGTIHPTKPNIALEIVNNAISAGTGDPRFAPVETYELDDLVYSVDILREPEPISGLEQLDIKRYGVIVRSGRRSGLLLPNLEGIESVEEQVAIARQKAGIGSDEPVELERFEVIRYY